MNAPPDEAAVLYESEQTPLAWKLLVAACTGAAAVGAVAFLRWFERADDLGLSSAGSLALGAGVALAMAGAASGSRVVRRVEVRGGALRLARDPGATEVFPLGDIATAASEPAAGGWSRDPAETLVLTLRGGETRRFTLPDDADTPGVVRDLEEHLAAKRGLAEIKEAP